MNPNDNQKDQTPLQQWLIGEVARRLEVGPEQIDADAEFDEFGLDSVQAVALSGALSDRVGEELPATLLYEHQSIRALASHLAAQYPHACGVEQN
ncbi:MAG: acyl carrier protein [Planctomycetota bacterium]|jgi:acyl carrier protein